MAKVKKRPDKIFNNSYYHGNSIKGNYYRYDEKIEADSEEIVNQYNKSSLNPEMAYPYLAIEKTILLLIKDNSEIQEILKNNKKKFNKQKINIFFQLILEHFDTSLELKRIKEVIYIFDVISRLTGIKTMNLFDLLEYEYKQIILDELDESHNIYKNYNKDNKFF